MGPSRSCWNSTTSALQPEEITSKRLEFHVCTINKSAHTKKVLKLIVCTSYIYGRTGNKSDSMKIYRDEKTKCLQGILFIELFNKIKKKKKKEKTNKQTTKRLML